MQPLAISEEMPVFKCVAVCCSVLQCVAVCCSVLAEAAQPLVILEEMPVFKCVALCGSALQCVAVYCSMLAEAAQSSFSSEEMPAFANRFLRHSICNTRSYFFIFGTTQTPGNRGFWQQRLIRRNIDYYKPYTL